MLYTKYWGLNMHRIKPLLILLLLLLILTITAILALAHGPLRTGPCCSATICRLQHHHVDVVPAHHEGNAWWCDADRTVWQQEGDSGTYCIK
jgi:hypothetical protein